MRWQWLNKWLTLLFALISVVVAAQTIQFNEERSKIEFEIKHMGVLTVKGRFKDFSGSMIKTKEGWDIKGTIEVKSIDTGNSDRDATLLEKQYLNTIEFPKIIFNSTAVWSKDKYTINGALMIRGKTNQISFFLAEKNNTFSSNELMLSRKQLQLDFGGMDSLIGDEIKISLILAK